MLDTQAISELSSFIFTLENTLNTYVLDKTIDITHYIDDSEDKLTLNTSNR